MTPPPRPSYSTSVSFTINKMHIFFLFLLTTTAATTTTTNRRTLHQPFFPGTTTTTISPTPPPSLPPSQPPTIPPPSPNIPFLPSPNNQPFFPSTPFPPPPPPPSLSSASFPANISALNLPTTQTHKNTSSKLIPIAITLALTALIILLIILLFKFLHRKKQNDDTSEKPANNNNLFTTVSANNGNSYNKIPKLTRPSQTSSEFLYLGTLVNSHGGLDTTRGNNNNNVDTPLEKVGSPELRPLPPLSGNGGGRSQTILQNDVASPVHVSEFEECYSPGMSDGVGAPAAGNYQTRRSSTSSYSSSSSESLTRSISLSISPPVTVTPRTSGMKLPDLVGVQTAPPPSRPPPPLPEVGLSKDSLESSPRFSYSSNDKTFSPVRIPPPPPVSTKLPEVKNPMNGVNRLNPPVLVKPNRSLLVSSHQPVTLSNEMLLENKDVATHDETRKLKPELKKFHSDKITAGSDRKMVWDRLKSNSVKLNEEMIETLFKHPISNESEVLDRNKSHNIAIAFRAFNVTTKQVCDALLEGNVDALGAEHLESLLKMAPTKEEERKLKEYRDMLFKLGPAEKFLKAVLDVPFAFKRVGAMLYVSNFDSEVQYLKQSFQTVEAACEELRNNRMFVKLLEAVLKTGNRMNIGTNREEPQAFKLNTLFKLIDIKGADGKTTLLHFVVQEIIRTEGARLQTVSSLGSDLSNVKKAAVMDSQVIKGDVTRLSNGIANIADIVKLMESTKFSNAMNKFLKMAQTEVNKIRFQESETVSLVKEIIEYFHGDSIKEEAHPLRMFTVVKEFLTVLDRVCKDVGSVNDQTMVDGFDGRQKYGSSSDDESSSSL